MCDWNEPDDEPYPLIYIVETVMFMHSLLCGLE